MRVACILDDARLMSVNNGIDTEQHALASKLVSGLTQIKHAMHGSMAVIATSNMLIKATCVSSC